VGLNDREVAFVREYLVDLNATKAAIRAGYSPRSARTTSSRLLAKANIQEAVQRATSERAKRVEVTADDVVRELALLAFSDLGRAFGANGRMLSLEEMPEAVRRTLASVEVDEDDDEGTVRKVRTWDKIRALELLGKHLRMFVDQTENHHRVEVSIETAREQLRARLVALASRARPRLPDSIPPA
jgi:phage terminase small subunit